MQEFCCRPSLCIAALPMLYLHLMLAAYKITLVTWFRAASKNFLDITGALRASPTNRNTDTERFTTKLRNARLSVPKTCRLKLITEALCSNSWKCR